MAHKIVLGSGIGGLSAAYYLSKLPQTQPVILLEGTSRTGGWIKSTEKNGIIYEQGPRTIRPRGPSAANTLQLIEELQLESKIISISRSHPAATNRMIYANGQLHTLPSSLMGLFLRSSPFEKPLINYILNDLTSKSKCCPRNDEPLYDFVERRFGKEIADYAISPLVCGICAGNAKEISVKFLMESFFEKEQKYGSIATGMLMGMFSRNKKDNPSDFTSNLARKAKAEKWSIYSFEGGLETLPATLERRVKEKGVDLILNSPCTSIEFKDKVLLRAGDKTLECNHLISSILSNNLSQLLVQKEHEELKNLLNGIPNVTVAVINLHYDKKVLNQDGFGVLVPPKERLPILGVIFDSCCFPRGNNTVLTAMLGGYWYDEYFFNLYKDEDFLKITLSSLERILGISDRPVDYKVNVLKNCIPQYNVGHKERVEKIQNYIKAKKLPLSLCGISYHGVGVNDVILSARKAVENLP